MRLPRGGRGANFLCYVHVFAVSFSAYIYGFQAEAGCLLRRLSQSVFRSDAVLALVVIGTTARLAFQKPPPRPLSTAMLAGAHQVGDAWHMLVPYARPPPGLEQLQFSECFGHQAAEMAAELDNDARVVVYQLKRERANELGLGDLGVAVSRAMSAPAGAERNCLLDFVVLSLAENNLCSNRADFDDALKDLLGEKLDAVWRSRFYGSVYHSLRVHGIPCFKRKRSRHGAKLKLTGPTIPARPVWLIGPEKPDV